MSHLQRSFRDAIRLPGWTTVLISASLLASLLSGCAVALPEPASQPASISPPWTHADLRLIDPSDAPLPEQDLLAVFLRRVKSRSATRWEARLDFLDMPVRNQTDIYLALDFAPSGSKHLPFASAATLDWDVLIHLSPSAPIIALDSLGHPLPDLSLLVQRDPPQASLVISFNGTALYPIPGKAAPPEIALQVFVVSPETNQTLDQTPPIRSLDAPPPPASLLLAFNQTFPAYTPAQALRRWDGAHTGPAGGRHGLANLIRLARNRGIPLALLDLKYPPWLSALDYAGGMDQVHASLESGLLILPDYFPPLDPAGRISLYAQNIAEEFNLPSSQYGYANFATNSISSRKAAFIPIRSASPLTSIYRWQAQRLIPLPLLAAEDPNLQPNLNGLSLLSRRLLVQTALDAASQPTATPILVLGGDLTRSAWGIPDVARAAFAYIQNHPWIRPLGADDLLNLPAASPLPELQPLYPNPPGAVARLPWERLFSSPQFDPLLEASRQAALALIPPAPPNVPEFAALQEIYSRQVNILIAASRWAQNPQPAADCKVDLDLDGAPECLLASQNLYLVFEPEAGALTHAFWLAPDGPHQIIAPSSQFTFGASDPAVWDPSANLTADPAVIPGAFYDGFGEYQAQIAPGQLSLTDPVRGLSKRFSLLPDGIRIKYQSSSPLVVRLPLALDPWARFEPRWGALYHSINHGDEWIWGIRQSSARQAGIQGTLTTNGRLQVSAFNDTQALMGQLENPNAEFPPGHYLPFPVALAEISAGGEFWLEASLSLK